MDLNGIWQAFTDTGDPLCYLLYRKAAEEKEAEKKKAPPGRPPRAEE